MRRPASWLLPVLVGTIGLVGCSTGEPTAPPDVPDTPATTTTPPPVSSPVETTIAEVEPTVAMTVRLGGIDHSLDSDALEDGDPFGDFAACSGLRDLIGNYTVAIGSEDGDIEWVSVTSTSRIESSGIVDADIRVETASDRIDASGTLTLESSLQSGTFVGFDDAGDRVVGSFRCDGASSPDLIGPDTEPLLEVVVLLRRGTSQRVVTLAGDDPAVIACADGDMIARADGDRSIGAITRFELSTTGALLLTVGAIDYDAERADVHQNADGDSGSFDAAVGDVTIDGAYSCT